MRSERERADGHGVLRVRTRGAGRASGAVGLGAKLGRAWCGQVRGRPPRQAVEGGQRGKKKGGRGWADLVGLKREGDEFFKIKSFSKSIFSILNFKPNSNGI